MPYKAKCALPDGVWYGFPVYAQHIGKQAFNRAWEQYKDKDDRRDNASLEESAHKVMCAAVKHDYKKGNNDK